VSIPWTPGPWQWFTDGNGGWYLATPHHGRLLVMDVWTNALPGTRSRTQRPELRFALRDGPRGGLLVPASQLGVNFPLHPDARLLPLSPELAELALRAEKIIRQLDGSGWVQIRESFLEESRRLIAAAGTTPLE
jgi:hypothetical protein